MEAALEVEDGWVPPVRGDNYRSKDLTRLRFAPKRGRPWAASPCNETHPREHHQGPEDELRPLRC